MISIKTPEEIKVMREAGAIAGRILQTVGKAVRIGVSTWELNLLAEKLMQEAGVTPSFKTVENYQFATCININNGVVHGLPSKDVVIKAGDIVKIDLGVIHQGWHSDTATSVYMPSGDAAVDQKIEKFLAVGQEALVAAIGQCRNGNRLSDISREIEDAVEVKNGYSVVYELTGHGIGRQLHEAPDVPGVLIEGPDPRLAVGMTLAIEVIYCFGEGRIKVSPDKWTINTTDGSKAGLFEHTIAITSGDPLVLTVAE